MTPPCALVPLTTASGGMYAAAGTTIGIRSWLTCTSSCFTTVRYNRGKCHADATCKALVRYAMLDSIQLHAYVSVPVVRPYQHYAPDAALIHEGCHRLGLRQST
jgi:hypothetical protein